jgi:hypothetical protein
MRGGDKARRGEVASQFDDSPLTATTRRSTPRIRRQKADARFGLLFQSWPSASPMTVTYPPLSIATLLAQ